MTEITVTFTRTIQPKQFESSKAEVTITRPLTEGEDLTAAMQAEFMEARAAVYEQLGIEFTLEPSDGGPGVLREAGGPAHEAVTAPAGPPPAAQPSGFAPPPGGAPQAPVAGAPTGPPPSGGPVAAPPPSAPAGGGGMKMRDPKPEDEQWWDFLVQSMNSGDMSGWYDNRTNKKNPKSPDFKHKESGTGLWLNATPQRYYQYFGVGQ